MTQLAIGLGRLYHEHVGCEVLGVSGVHDWAFSWIRSLKSTTLPWMPLWNGIALYWFPECKACLRSLKKILGAATFTLERTRKRKNRVHRSQWICRWAWQGCGPFHSQWSRSIWPNSMGIYLPSRGFRTIRSSRRTNLWATMRFWRSLNVWAPYEVWQTEHRGRKYLQRKAEICGQRHVTQEQPGNCWVTTQTCSCFNIWWNVCLMNVSWIDRDAFRQKTE